MPNRWSSVHLLLALGVIALPSWALPHGAVDRRVVDTVSVGNPTSEAAHGYAADDAVRGIAAGRAFRQARGWMHYSLKTFEDTDVTVALTFLGDSVSRSYDVVVEDSVVATRSVPARAAGTPVVEVTVPFALTKGKASIALVLRARGGLTPRLLEVRTIQDHYELDLAQFTHVSPDRSTDRSPHTFGVPR